MGASARGGCRFVRFDLLQKGRAQQPGGDGQHGYAQHLHDSPHDLAGQDKIFWRMPRLPHGATFARDRSPWRPRLLRYLKVKMRARPPAAYQYHDR